MTEPITSSSNPKLRLVRRLQSAAQRERLGLFVCEGEDLIAAGLEAGLEPKEVLVDAGRPVLEERVPEATLVSSELMDELSELAHPARAIAVFHRSGLPRLDRRRKENRTSRPRRSSDMAGEVVWPLVLPPK